MKNYNRPMLYRLYTIHNMVASGDYPMQPDCDWDLKQFNIGFNKNEK